MSYLVTQKTSDCRSRDLHLASEMCKSVPIPRSTFLVDVYREYRVNKVSSWPGPLVVLVTIPLERLLEGQVNP